MNREKEISGTISRLSAMIGNVIPRDENTAVALISCGVTLMREMQVSDAEIMQMIVLAIDGTGK